MRFADGRRVCVIGAGCAGLSAAARLQEKGWEVTVLERSERIGGKCLTRTLELDGRSLAFDLGATVVAVSYRELVRIGRALGERTKAVNPYMLVDDAGSVTPLRSRYWPERRQHVIAGQLLRYMAHVRRFYARHVSATGFREVPEVYEQPFAEYCRAHDMGELLRWFELPIVAWGYGDLEQLPTWYVFGEIDLAAALGLAVTVGLGASSLVQAWEHGFGHLLQRMAERSGLDVRTSTPARAIRRSDAGVTVVTDAGELEFDYLVCSAPQVVKLFAAPSPSESRFLADIVHTPYATALCSIDRELSAKLIVEANLRRVDAIKLVAAQHPACATVVCYANVSAGTDEAGVRAIVGRDLARLGLGLIEIHEVALWPDYFPRFTSFAGYEALLEAQGRRRTIFVGAINRFEFTEAAAASARAMIDAHFVDHVRPPRERFTVLRNLGHMLGAN